MTQCENERHSFLYDWWNGCNRLRPVLHAFVRAVRPTSHKNLLLRSAIITQDQPEKKLIKLEKTEEGERKIGNTYEEGKEKLQ